MRTLLDLILPFLLFFQQILMLRLCLEIVQELACKFEPSSEDSACKMISLYLIVAQLLANDLGGENIYAPRSIYE